MVDRPRSGASSQRHIRVGACQAKSGRRRYCSHYYDDDIHFVLPFDLEQHSSRVPGYLGKTGDNGSHMRPATGTTLINVWHLPG